MLKKEIARNVAGVIIFYLIIILGVIALNARMESINPSSTPVVFSN